MNHATAREWTIQLCGYLVNIWTSFRIPHTGRHYDKNILSQAINENRGTDPYVLASATYQERILNLNFELIKYLWRHIWRNRSQTWSTQSRYDNKSTPEAAATQNGGADIDMESRQQIASICVREEQRKGRRPA